MDPRLRDHSADLWRPELGPVPRDLLTSAVRRFASKGYHATTTRDITSAVGLTPSALYAHFPSKEQVLFEIVRTGHEAVLDHIADLPSTALEGPAEQLASTLSRYTAWHARHHVTVRVCQVELAALTAEHYELIRNTRRTTNEVFRSLLAGGIAAGSFRELDVNRVVRALLSLSIDIVRWYRLDGDDSPESLGDFHADLALRMVLRPDLPHVDSRPRSSIRARNRH